MDFDKFIMRAFSCPGSEGNGRICFGTNASNQCVTRVRRFFEIRQQRSILSNQPHAIVARYNRVFHSALSSYLITTFMHLSVFLYVTRNNTLGHPQLATFARQLLHLRCSRHLRHLRNNSCVIYHAGRGLVGSNAETSVHSSVIMDASCPSQCHQPMGHGLPCHLCHYTWSTCTLHKAYQQCHVRKCAQTRPSRPRSTQEKHQQVRRRAYERTDPIVEALPLSSYHLCSTLVGKNVSWRIRRTY